MIRIGDRVRYTGKKIALLGREGQVMNETVKPGVWCVGFGNKAWFVREKHLMPVGEAAPDSLVAVTTELARREQR